MSKHAKSLPTRAEAHPKLRQYFESLLDLVENKDHKLILADDAEDAVIEGTEGLRQALLEAWSEKESNRQSDLFGAEKTLRKHTKKNSTGIRGAGK